jgi:HEPN domain-containing protein
MSSQADLARVLLALARDDDIALRALIDGKGVSDAVIGFHAQQAVEKSLKAVLAAQALEFPYSHDLDGLVELCVDAGVEVPSDLSGVEALSPFGVQFRYGAFEPARLERKQAVRWSEAAVTWAARVVDQLP